MKSSVNFASAACGPNMGRHVSPIAASAAAFPRTEQALVKNVRWGQRTLPRALALGVLVGTFGCEKPNAGKGHAGASAGSVPAHQDAHDEHEHEHAHNPPHGGHLIPVGEHFANLEIVQDTETGDATLYVFDSCADKMLRLRQEIIAVRLVTAIGEGDCEFRAFENALTGEKPGDASEFRGESPLLKARIQRGEIHKLSVLGKEFEQISFQLP